MQTIGDLENQRKVSALYHKSTRKTSVEEAVLIWALREGLERGGGGTLALYQEVCPTIALEKEQMWGVVGYHRKK